LSYLPQIVQLLLFLIVVPAALFDLKERRVPNWITLPGLAVAIALNSFLYETPGLWLALEGLGVAMLIYFPLYMLRGMGAGDVKLMAAIGAAAGWANWIGILFLTAIFGGIFALVLVLWRRQLRGTVKNIGFIILSLWHRHAPHLADPALDVKNDEAIRLPHAIAIAFGTLGYLVAAAIWAAR
jgi:prepilin peptidase CpaA